MIASGRTGAQVVATLTTPNVLPSFPVTVQLDADGGTCWTSRLEAG